MPITSLVYLPPNQALATLEERLKIQNPETEKEKEKEEKKEKEELGWLVSSSVDYMITVKQLTVKGIMHRMIRLLIESQNGILELLFSLMLLLFVIWYGYYILSHAYL